MKCAQPGCTGTVVDGYCDLCGMPPSSNVAAAAAAARAEEEAATSRSAAVGSVATGAVVGGAVAAGGGGGAVGGVDFAPSAPSRVSNRLASAPIGSARAAALGSKVTRRVGTTSTRLRGARLGAGLTTVPPVPAIDAAGAIMTNPEVPEERRSCPACGAPVGRSRDGRPGRTEGFCPKCRNPFSFTPKLTAGDLVAGQYEVAGCLAHGGLGWIYLARDRNVSDRWVVLKGLLNSGDPDALAAAIAERQFLAQVEHPLIVEIYNFVTHDGAGYIVMEYVGGTSLKALLKDRMKANGGRYAPVPVDQAIAYLVEVLPAFQYLHDLGLVYCDMKPDNLIQVGDAIKLIDLGGVRRIDDVDSAIYGTVGYQAPEVPEVGPSVAGDIYTIGRTLAVLVMEFRGYQSTYVASLPPAADVPLFQQYDSLYRLLLKACAPDPADRFASADELRVQLLGVLREVVASGTDGAAQHSTSSLLFTAPTVSADTLAWDDLPEIVPDTGDPMTSWLRSVSVDEPVARLKALAAAPERTAEVRLATARAALGAQAGDVLDAEVAALLADDPWDWRGVWLQGLSALQKDDAAAARSLFNAVYGQVPGELAPKLALALACERTGEADVAEALYTICARTDANYLAPAAFGLARIRVGRRDVDGAVAALDLVPATSRAYPKARRERAGLLAASGRGLPALAAALESVQAVSLDPLDRVRLEANVLDAALTQVLAKGPVPTQSVGGHRCEEAPLRDGLEQTFRKLATLEDDHAERVRLVDRANTVRRWTLR